MRHISYAARYRILAPLSESATDRKHPHPDLWDLKRGWDSFHIDIRFTSYASDLRDVRSVSERQEEVILRALHQSVTFID